jgi:putative endonuclease
VNFLQAKGYKILEVNKRFGRAEVDIIAQIGLETVFVEVKTRSSSYSGFPEESIDKKKIRLNGQGCRSIC